MRGKQALAQLDTTSSSSSSSDSSSFSNGPVSFASTSGGSSSFSSYPSDSASTKESKGFQALEKDLPTKKADAGELPSRGLSLLAGLPAWLTKTRISKESAKLAKRRPRCGNGAVPTDAHSLLLSADESDAQTSITRRQELPFAAKIAAAMDADAFIGVEKDVIAAAACTVYSGGHGHVLQGQGQGQGKGKGKGKMKMMTAKKAGHIHGGGRRSTNMLIRCRRLRRSRVLLASIYRRMKKALSFSLRRST